MGPIQTVKFVQLYTMNAGSDMIYGVKSCNQRGSNSKARHVNMTALVGVLITLISLTFNYMLHLLPLNKEVPLFLPTR